MTLVEVLGGDFAKTTAKFGAAEIAFHRKDSKADLEVVERGEISHTFGTEGAMRHPT